MKNVGIRKFGEREIRYGQVFINKQSINVFIGPCCSVFCLFLLFGPFLP
jgi:hypothetical protein